MEGCPLVMSLRAAARKSGGSALTHPASMNTSGQPQFGTGLCAKAAALSALAARFALSTAALSAVVLACPRNHTQSSAPWSNNVQHIVEFFALQLLN